jgi:signal transduction histidine kinase/ActR/RegA family two-component response regulator
LLDLRPAPRGDSRVAGLRQPTPAAAKDAEARAPRPGSWLSLLHEAGRLAKASLARIFSLQGRIETAFLASGAAARLADAALEGEPTRELAGRIATLARQLARAAGATVHLRTQDGLQSLASDGEPSTATLAERALESGQVEWNLDAAAVPLRMREKKVGALSIQFATGSKGAPRDLRPLQPLLTRAGAVLAAAERESRKDRFLSLAAHELKTPLTSIKGFSYSLARRLEKGEPCDPKHVQVLERQAERLHALLEEMLEVSRIETSRFTLHQEPCELLELMEASLRSLRRLGQDADLKHKVEPALPLHADRERIERALTAMVLHARSHGQPSIEAVRVQGHAEVRVSWQGEPLLEPHRALEPRWEAAPNLRQGLGMALVIARRAAELHGGILRAEANALVLSLPLRVASLEHQGGSEGRVLVVDDDEPLSRMMAEFLAENGFTADWAGGGHSALEKVRAWPPDVMVLDLRMPDLDGRGLLLAIRALGLAPRVVLFSADREVASAARELACEAFVEKPFAPDGLLLAVRRVLNPGAAANQAPARPSE